MLIDLSTLLKMCEAEQPYPIEQHGKVGTCVSLLLSASDRAFPSSLIMASVNPLGQDQAHRSQDEGYNQVLQAYAPSCSQHFSPNSPHTFCIIAEKPRCRKSCPPLPNLTTNSKTLRRCHLIICPIPMLLPEGSIPTPKRR